MKVRNLITSITLALAMICSLQAQEQSGFAEGIVTVNVLGQVNKPSRFALPEGAMLLDALATAGGETKVGNLVKVKVIHKSTEEEPDISVVDVKQILNGSAKDIALRDGDTVVVPESIF